MTFCKLLQLAAICIFICASTDGQVLRRGTCPNVTAMPDFNIKKFMGVWFEQVHTRRWAGDLKCSVEHFAQTEHRSFFINSFTFSPSANVSYQMKGTAKFSSPTGHEALMEVAIPDFNLTGTVWLLQTDYKSYAVIWSCKNADSSRYFENVMIMSRDKHAPSGTLMNGLAVLTSRKIAKTNLVYISNVGCPSYAGLLDEINKSLKQSAVEKIAPNSELQEIDIRMGN